MENRADEILPFLFPRAHAPPLSAGLWWPGVLQPTLNELFHYADFIDGLRGWTPLQLSDRVVACEVVHSAPLAPLLGIGFVRP